MKRLSGKVALITGAGRKNAIGSSCALRLAEEGAAIVVADITGSFDEFPGYKAGTGSEELAGIAGEIARLGVRSLPVPVDVTDPDSVRSMVEKVKKELGRIDILVNNAGGAPGPAPLTQFSLAAWEKTLAINLTGTFLCSREVAPVMIEGGGGKIINMSSRAAIRGAIWMHAYSAAKAGILGLTRSMALELAPFKICVNALCPGDIVTDLKLWGWQLEAQVTGKTVAEIQEAAAGATPLGRLGTPQDVAGAVAFFASPDSDYLTGEMLCITGGSGMRPIG
jgi:NAD(P)-dependent dehydrogenase (short-subunit alcohol dehydrogenase family)